jgi:hypothetical protein
MPRKRLSTVLLNNDFVIGAVDTNGLVSRIVSLRHLVDDILSAIIERNGRFPIRISSMINGTEEIRKTETRHAQTS